MTPSKPLTQFDNIRQLILLTAADYQKPNAAQLYDWYLDKDSISGPFNAVKNPAQCAVILLRYYFESGPMPDVLRSLPELQLSQAPWNKDAGNWPVDPIA